MGRDLAYITWTEKAEVILSTAHRGSRGSDGHAYGYTTGLLAGVMTMQSLRCARCKNDTEANTSRSASDEGMTHLLYTGGSNPAHCTQGDKEWSGVWRDCARDWEWDTETKPMKPLT